MSRQELDELRLGWVKGIWSLTVLADAYGTTPKTIERRAIRENWPRRMSGKEYEAWLYSGADEEALVPRIPPNTVPRPSAASVKRQIARTRRALEQLLQGALTFFDNLP
jgi:hypothetical protein